MGAKARTPAAAAARAAAPSSKLSPELTALVNQLARYARADNARGADLADACDRILGAPGATDGS